MKSTYLFFFLLISLLLNACVYSEKPKLTIVKSGTPVLLSSSTAQVDGFVIDAASELTEYGHCWSDKRNPTVQNNVASYKVQANTANNTTQLKDGTFTSSLTGLQSGTTYYVRAYAVSGNDIVYSADAETGPTGAATSELSVKNIAQVSASNVSKTQATFSSAIAGTSTRTLSDYGFVYSKDSKTPLTTDANSTKVSLFDPAQPKTGAISIALGKTVSGLSGNTTYYVSAYVVTTSNGNDLTLYARTIAGEGTAVRTPAN